MQKETAHATAAPAGRMRLILIVGAAALLASLILLARAAVSDGGDRPASDTRAPADSARPHDDATDRRRTEAPRLRGREEVRKLPYGEAPYVPARLPAPSSTAPADPESE